MAADRVWLLCVLALACAGRLAGATEPKPAVPAAADPLANIAQQKKTIEAEVKQLETAKQGGGDKGAQNAATQVGKLEAKLAADEDKLAKELAAFTKGREDEWEKEERGEIAAHNPGLGNTYTLVDYFDNLHSYSVRLLLNQLQLPYERVHVNLLDWVMRNPDTGDWQLFPNLPKLEYDAVPLLIIKHPGGDQEIIKHSMKMLLRLRHDHVSKVVRKFKNETIDVFANIAAIYNGSASKISGEASPAETAALKTVLDTANKPASPTTATTPATADDKTKKDATPPTPAKDDKAAPAPTPQTPAKEGDKAAQKPATLLEWRSALQPTGAHATDHHRPHDAWADLQQTVRNYRQASHRVLPRFLAAERSLQPTPITSGATTQPPAPQQPAPQQGQQQQGQPQPGQPQQPQQQGQNPPPAPQGNGQTPPTGDKPSGPAQPPQPDLGVHKSEADKVVPQPKTSDEAVPGIAGLLGSSITQSPDQKQPESTTPVVAPGNAALDKQVQAAKEASGGKGEVSPSAVAYAPPVPKDIAEPAKDGNMSKFHFPEWLAFESKLAATLGVIRGVKLKTGQVKLSQIPTNVPGWIMDGDKLDKLVIQDNPSANIRMLEKDAEEYLITLNNYFANNTYVYEHHYTIADIMIYPYIREVHEGNCGQELASVFKRLLHLKGWMNKIQTTDFFLPLPEFGCVNVTAPVITPKCKQEVVNVKQQS